MSVPEHWWKGYLFRKLHKCKFPVFVEDINLWLVKLDNVNDDTLYSIQWDSVFKYSGAEALTYITIASSFLLCLFLLQSWRQRFKDKNKSKQNLMTESRLKTTMNKTLICYCTQMLMKTSYLVLQLLGFIEGCILIYLLP